MTTPTLLCDFYKISHKVQYPEGTEFIYSTWTPRTSRIEGINKVVAYGFQGAIKKIHDWFADNFFNKSKLSVIAEYERIITSTLGVQNPDTSHIAALHNLGYLPIKIKAVKEGTLVDLRVPMLTIENTLPEFFWLTNFLETIFSCELFLPATSATTAFEYRKLLTDWARKTNSVALDFVPYQGHDFSMRGMGGLEAAELSGSGHQLCFYGTDTIPAICFLEKYYGADVTKELVGTSIPATEHSVMCAGGMEDEYETFHRLITKVYPSGFLSIVSDTWDYWHVLSSILPRLKDTILARDGKIVIRPDSGDPVKIICGDPESDNEYARKGTIEVLWDLFGGTVSAEGFKCLDPHIGCIYGDAITLSRCSEICEKLAAKGFASTNMVYGIGSYTYNYVTRDTFGFALKATHAIINGVEKAIFKDPKTDSGVKKSQCGRVAVIRKNEHLEFVDGLNSTDAIDGDLLELVYEDGAWHRFQTLAEIRRILSDQIE